MRFRISIYLLYYLLMASSLVAKPFVVAKKSNARITTHEITSGNVTLGITDMGGGMINKLTLPGIGDILGPQADKYGRGGQQAIRSYRYNPTQAGFTDTAGTQCEVTVETGALIVEQRPSALWKADGQYDFIEWENLASDGYGSDGGSSGRRSDLDGLDERDLPGKQADEITSEFDFFCTYENYQGINGIDIPCFRHYSEWIFARTNQHCLDQFDPGTPGWGVSRKKNDISVTHPQGVHPATEEDVANILMGAGSIRFDVAIWDPPYRFLLDSAGNWVTEKRGIEKQQWYVAKDSSIQPVLIVSDSSHPDQGPAFGIYYPPDSEINKQQVLGGSYTDNRLNFVLMRDQPRRIATMHKVDFLLRINGLLNINRTPRNAPETLRSEFFYLVGTPNQIMANIAKIGTGAPTLTLPNGGFETGGFDPWETTQSEGVTWSLTTDAVDSGSYAAMYDNTGLRRGRGGGTLVQTVLFTEDTPFTASIMMHGNKTQYATLRLEWLDASDQVVRTDDSLQSLTGEWQLVTVMGHSPMETVAVRFSIEISSTAHGPIYFDEGKLSRAQNGH